MSYFSALKRIKDRAIIHYISVILSYPKLTVLVPAILIFILSYNISYDFTIRTFNTYLSNHYAALPTELVDVAQNSNFMPEPFLQRIYDDMNNYSSRLLTKIALHKNTLFETGTDHGNVLTFEFFKQLYDLQHNLTNQYNISIISPLSDFPLNQIEFDSIDSRYGDTSKLNPTTFQSFLIKYINYDLTYLLTTLYTDQLVKSNQLIKYAKNVNIFLIHGTDFDISNAVSSFLMQKEKCVILLGDVIETSKGSSVKDFIRYYLKQKGSIFLAKMFFQSSNVFIFSTMVLYVLYMYISVANEHRVRSSFGLILGWVVGVVVSSTAAIRLTTLLHSKMSWKILFEPLTVFTKCAFVLAGFVLNSRYLFVVVRVLNNADEEGDLQKSNVEGGNNIYKNLYRLFSGFYSLPMITRDMISTFAGLMLTFFISKTAIHFYINGYLREYIISRLQFLSEAIAFTVLLQYFIHLTYIVGIALVDRNVVDITDYLENQHLGDSLSENPKDNTGVNIFSYLLLGLSRPTNARPLRNSWHYKLGQSFLRIHFPSRCIGCAFLIISFSLVLFMSIFMNWIMLMPCNILNDKKDVMNFSGLNILKNTNNFIYYVELVLILILIVAVSLVVFNLTTFEGNLGQFRNSDSKMIRRFSDFKNISPTEGSDTRTFNGIELLSNAGHYLDILKIKTNSKCSFVVTIGLDHKVLVWSPLSSKSSSPVNLSSTVKLESGEEKEFWPINHINISDDGNYVVLISYRYGLIKCFDRKTLSFIWELKLDGHLQDLIHDKQFTILESFFRRRTVPGFLARKILQKKKLERSSNPDGSHTGSRRGSNVSLSSMNLMMNGNFPAPQAVSSLTLMRRTTSGRNSNLFDSIQENEAEDQLIKDDFIIVLASGELLSLSCQDGKMRTLGVLEALEYPKETKLISLKRVSTPRVCDRIIFQVDNHDLIVATVMNNNWKCRKLVVCEGFYNQPQMIAPVKMAPTNSRVDTDFTSLYDSNRPQENTERACTPVPGKLSNILVNDSVLVSIEFVGMIIRVQNFVAELIDLQKGIILKTFNVGHFKASSFRVAHSEPTHCKFCGCASIKSFSIIYEDNYSLTLIIHTFKIDNKKSKNNICLRVERDPREIRCLGFNAVTEHQYWFNGIEAWELTDVNMIIGVRKNSAVDDDAVIDDEISTGRLSTFFGTDLRNRKAKGQSKRISEKMTVAQLWEGFIITAHNGKISLYNIPDNRFSSKNIVSGNFSCVEKYGYKSIILSTLNLMEILYLGNDKLIEEDIYFSGTNATIKSILNEDNSLSPNTEINQPVNSELMFISKRRKMRERLRR